MCTTAPILPTRYSGCTIQCHIHRDPVIELITFLVNVFNSIKCNGEIAYTCKSLSQLGGNVTVDKTISDYTYNLA